MDRTAIEKIEKMSKANVLEINGNQYTDKPVHLVERPTASEIEIGSLTGIVDYVNANIDSYDKSILFIQVIDHLNVLLLSAFTVDTKQRDVLIHAQFEQLNFTYDRYYSVEEMVIKMRTCFVQTDQMKDVIRLIGNIKDESVKTVVDDGISQQVTAKTGISRVGDVVIPNPVSLAPYRTFYEIDQPCSDFLLRMKRGSDLPDCALYAADGGQWKREAVDRIKEWLSEKLDGIIIIG